MLAARAPRQDQHRMGRRYADLRRRKLTKKLAHESVAYFETLYDEVGAVALT